MTSTTPSYPGTPYEGMTLDEACAQIVADGQEEMRQEAEDAQREREGER